MPSSFIRQIGGEVILDGDVNELQVAIERDTAGIFNVLEFGAEGDGVTNDTAAIEQAILATIAARGVLNFPPDHTYLVDEVVGANGLVVRAHGATFQHTGGVKPLLDLDGDRRAETIERMVWHGGEFIAAQSLGATTSLLHLRRAFYCEFSDMHFECGDNTPLATNRYADYGILIEGAQNKGNFWHNWYGVRVRGARVAGCRVDGQDPVTGLNHTGPDWWHGCRFIFNEVGFQIVGANYEIFLGGQIEQNASYGLYLDYFAKDTDAYGLHLEHNNGGAGFPQFYVETRTPAGFPESQNGRRNSIRGAISGNPENDLGDELAAVRHLSVYQNVGSLQMGVVPRALRNLVLQRETTNDIAMQFDTDGETNPRMRWTTGGQLQYRDPANDTADYFNALLPAAMNEIITGADVIFRPRGGVRVGEGTTVKKILKQFVNLDFPSIPAHSTAEMTAVVTGVAAQDFVAAVPRVSFETGLIWSAYVSAADTVTVRVANVTTGAIDAAARAFDVFWMDMT